MPLNYIVPIYIRSIWLMVSSKVIYIINDFKPEGECRVI